MSQIFADIILPLPVRGRFTYRIPDDLKDEISRGSRVIVPFGKKNILAGIVMKLHEQLESSQETRDIISLTKNFPPANSNQLELWEWMAGYYMCCEGEVMK